MRAIPLFIILVGCGSDTGSHAQAVYSCDYRKGAKPSAFCEDLVDKGQATQDTIDYDMRNCMQNQFASGAWSSSGCDRTGTLGGCVIYPATAGDGYIEATQWYFVDDTWKTSADAKKFCFDYFPGAKWIDP